jgi:thimet oligopeptidase
MRLGWSSLSLLALAACAGQQQPQADAPPPQEQPPVAAAAASAPPAPPPVWQDAGTLGKTCSESLRRARAIRAQLERPAMVDRSMEGGEGDEAGPQAALAGFNHLWNEIDQAGSLFSLMANVHPERVVRDEAERCEREIQALVAEINLDRGLYDALNGIREAGLDEGAKRFRQKLLLDFRRSGVDKDDATRERLRKLHAEMVETGQAFNRNIREGATSIEVDPADLAGLPPDFVAKKTPNDKGKVVLTTDYPDYFPVATYAQRESVRKALTVQLLNRGHPDNGAVLKKLLELRQTYVEALGYASWAQYQAEDKMVGSAAAIERFIGDITKIARPRMEREVKELLARKKKDDPKAKAIEAWDRFYYVEKVRAEKFGFDSLAARPYFEYGRTLDGMFAVYAELFGLTFEKVDAPVWHPSVRAYDLLEDGVKIGRFYLDMFPRDGKYSHAAMFPISVGLSSGQMPQAALVCNFTDPSQGQALLEHNQVTTLFHEFGHLIHHLLARSSPWVRLSGISTEWDFVEAPSQLLEEWTWDVGVLQRFAKHVETNEPIPAEMVAKLKSSAEFGKGTHVMRQVFYTALSYYLHALDPKKLDLDATSRDLTKRYSPYPHIENTHLYAGFGHLDHYSSMYYTYQWSLVLAKDIFTRFTQAGLLDRATARDYREKVLKVGGSKDAQDLVRDFLGRGWSLDAYKRWLEAN